MKYFPETVRIDVTGSCNLKCKHCQANMFLNRKEDELSTEQWKNIIEQLAKAGCITISILGGEPFLRKDIFELLTYMSSLGIRTTVTTNGTLLNEKKIDSLIYDTNTSVVFSLDGHNDITHDLIRGRGSFLKTINNIKIFSAKLNNANRHLLGISYVIHNNNINYHSEIFKLCTDLHVDSLSLAMVHKTGRAVDNWDSLKITDCDAVKMAEELALIANDYQESINIRFDLFPPAYRDFINRKLSISIRQDVLIDDSGVSGCYIQHDGRVFPSQPISEMIPNLLKNAESEMITFNNNSLRKNAFIDIWNGKEFSTFRKAILSRNYIETLSPCLRCKFKNTYCQPSFSHYLKREKYAHILCKHVYEE